MIHLIVGRQGSGKSLFLVKKAYEYHLQGKNVYSNIALNFPYKKMSVKDIVECKLENGVVILDEVHLLLSARNSMSRRSREICDSFLSMVRKKNLIILATTQFERKVDIRFREEKDFYYICEKWYYNGRYWIEAIDNRDRPIETPIMIKLKCMEMFSGNSVEFSFQGNKYFSMYNSKEIVKIQ